MSTDDPERLAAEAKRDRGYLLPEYAYAAQHDPDFVAAYNEYYRKALARESGLPVKYRELVALALLAYRGVSDAALVNHVRRAVDHGATRAEVLGALEAAAIPGGAPTFYNGVRALMKFDQEET